MKNKYIKIIVCMFIPFIITYLLGAVISWEGDLGAWSEKSRIGWVLFSSLFSLAGLAFGLLIDWDWNN